MFRSELLQPNLLLQTVNASTGVLFLNSWIIIIIIFFKNAVVVLSRQ